MVDLPQGHYLLMDEKDGLRGSEWYFVVLPDSAWETVQYWISYGGAVCGVSRTRGTYTMDDSSIALIEVESGEAPDNCPITQSDFDSISWEAAPTGTSTVMDIRNVTADSFEARGGFAEDGWRKFYRQADPHGFYD